MLKKILKLNTKNENYNLQTYRISGLTEKYVNNQSHQNILSSKQFDTKITEIINNFPLFDSNNLIPYPNQSAITQKLWLKRISKNVNQTLTEPPMLITKSPKDSEIEYILPFSSDLKLRGNYLSPYGNLRIGRLLEDLDSIAALVTLKHCENENDGYKKFFVTVSVDTINILMPLMPDRDIKLNGVTTWVGNSSMEIMIKVSSKDNETNKWSPILVTTFTMVCLDKKTMKPTKINSLKVETPFEKKLFEDSEKRRSKRLNSNDYLSLNSLKKINNLLIPSNHKSPLEIDFEEENHSLKDLNSQLIPMESTKNNSIILCQPQEKNINDKIFGGYLIRMGLENAFSTCMMKFSESLPVLKSIDGFKFLKATEVGDILNFESTITYTKPINENSENPSYYTQLQVLVYATNPFIGEKQLTCIFNFTFHCPSSPHENSNKKIKQILPQNYSEGIRYLKGKRIIDNFLKLENSPSQLDVFKNE
ncbi:hypothetical protein RB653_003885 [Dictyostelium firmibasis]|uniref:HotDog ACOT-type domain-containing protein n=1 Tax=Dictyostelium firmibasis TaxID=79012 RepID=A0AAN7TZY1_9MYCE